jgi:hypothetical protein
VKATAVSMRLRIYLCALNIPIARAAHARVVRGCGAMTSEAARPS